MRAHAGRETEQMQRERERERENFFFLNFNNPLLQILFHNIIKLQYSFIRKPNPTHKCVKTKSPSKTEHKASL